MRAQDVTVAEELSGAAYAGAERFGPRGTPGAPTRSPVDAQAWVERTRHLLASDPDGCWVAEQDGVVVGFAVSFRRGLLWLLASYAVRPDVQDTGVGRTLLGAALSSSRGCLRAMFCSSADPRAYRRYRLAGFSLHPMLSLTGVVDRSRLPAVEHVREGSASDLDLMDSLDRQRREAAHGVDHALLGGRFRLVVTDHTTGSGYAYLDAHGGVQLLAASNRRTATRLLWEALASAPAAAPVTVHHVTPANEWAVDVGLDARLSVATEGYLALRGMRPPMPYLPHGSLM